LRTQYPQARHRHITALHKVTHILNTDPEDNTPILNHTTTSLPLLIRTPHRLYQSILPSKAPKTILEQSQVHHNTIPIPRATHKGLTAPQGQYQTWHQPHLTHNLTCIHCFLQIQNHEKVTMCTSCQTTALHSNCQRHLPLPHSL
jgi:hypothetical protein